MIVKDIIDDNFKKVSSNLFKKKILNDILRLQLKLIDFAFLEK